MLGVRSTLLLSATSTGILKAVVEAVLGDADAPDANSAGSARRKVILRVLWVAGVVAALIVSLVAIGVSRWWTGGFKAGIAVSVVIWALLIGGSALVFLSAKTITALFGALFGLSISEASSAAGVITRMSGQLTELARQVGTIGGARVGEPDHFILAMVWTFVVLVGLVCLPAFFAD